MPGFPNDQSNPAGAIPVYVTSGGGGGNAVTMNDVSTDLAAGIPQLLLPANPARKYLFIQTISPNTPIYVNFMGSEAAPDSASSFLLAFGQTYESGAYVSGEEVWLYSDVTTIVTIAEG